jgi:uncharacterized protein DUF1259
LSDVSFHENESTFSEHISLSRPFQRTCVRSGCSERLSEVLKIKTLDRKGDFKAGVLKINVPRNDLKMTIQGVPTPTPFGFGGWLAMTKTSDGADVMMGDLVLLQDEVNPVMSALLGNGIEWCTSTCRIKTFSR